MSSGLLPVSPARPVWVHDRSAWYQGQLEAWRRSEDGWRAHVRYRVGVGMTHLGWFDEGQVRPTAEDR